MKQKRKMKRKVRRTILVTVLCLMIVMLGGLFGYALIPRVKSVNENANRYKNGSCIAFYPDGELGKDRAMSLCQNSEEEAVYDYTLVKQGDYYLVSYDTGLKYYMEENGRALKVKEIDPDGKLVLSDFLRYSMKKDELDIAYTSKFLMDTYYENLDISDLSYEVDGEDLKVYFPKYDYSLSVPLKYIEHYAHINLGHAIEEYEKPVYVSDKRKKLALTFDDGPFVKTSSIIVDTLYKFDSRGTFFVLGNRLDNETVPFIKESIGKGMQYGSHSQNHKNLTKLSDSEVFSQIKQPANDLYNGYDDPKYGFEALGYEMSIYRAPYGEHDARVDSISPYINIGWNVDTRDWATRDRNSIKAVIDSKLGNMDGSIVLMHDIYSETAKAVEDIVPELIDEGYQLVTVSELLKSLGIDEKNTAYYPW